jgi:gliding motility associated protien GldN
MKYLFVFLFISTTLIGLKAQDDDFFLNDPKSDVKAPNEATLFDQNEDLTAYYDDVVPRTLIEDNRILEYEPLREVDVMWEKRIWRVIDTREKMNNGFRNFKRPFFNILKEKAESGEIKVFRDEFFKEALDADAIAGMMNRIDTSVVYDPETYEEQIKITQNPINPNDIVKFRVKEVWFFDKKTSQVKVRILGIAPIQDKYEETTGEFLYEIPMFWVYYPKARTFLAKERVYNDFNDIAPMSWYDLFESRFFASYIYAQSNSLGLRLQDIYDNEYDRLLESQKIKQELFNWEHDLWTY